jgi:hypothetical protein
LQKQPCSAPSQRHAGPHRHCWAAEYVGAADIVDWQPHWQPLPGQFVQVQRSVIVFIVSSFVQWLSG